MGLSSEEVDAFCALVKRSHNNALARWARQPGLVPEQYLVLYSELIERGAGDLIPTAEEANAEAARIAGERRHLDGHHRTRMLRRR